MGVIEVAANAITKDEQLEIGRLLLKAGYTVNITNGKSVNGKSNTYINYQKMKGEKRSE